MAGNAFDPAGLRVVVTGGSSGIGSATAIEFARRGAAVGVCARREDRLREVVEQCRGHGADATMWPADLADIDSIDALAQQMIDDLGGIDVLVNNAGAPRRRLMQAITPAEFDATMTINFTAPMRLTLAVLPHMLDRGNGHIVNVGSSGTRKIAPRTGAYVAAKAALDSFTEGLYLDLAGTGVRAHLFIPGTTSTEFSIEREGNDPPFPVRPGDAETPENVAVAIVDCLATDVFETYPNQREVDYAAEKRADFNGYLLERTQVVRTEVLAPARRIAVGSEHSPICPGQN